MNKSKDYRRILGMITDEQVLEYCEERLPYYKTPKFVVFVRSFKKDPSGQILKDLIEEAT